MVAAPAETVAVISVTAEVVAGIVTPLAIVETAVPVESVVYTLKVMDPLALPDSDIHTLITHFPAPVVAAVANCGHQR